MQFAKYPLFTIIISFSIGIILQFLFHFNFQLLLYSSIFLGILLAFTYFKFKDTTTSLFGFLTFLSSLVLGSFSLFIHKENNHKIHYSNQAFFEKNKIEALVIEELKPNEFYYKYIIEISNFNSQKAKGKVLLNFSKKNNEKPEISDNIKLICELNPIAKRYNPNQFDYALYLENQNVYHQVTAYDNDYFITEKSTDFNFYIHKLRTRLINSFAIHDFSSQTNSIVNALVFGQKQDLDKTTLEDYKNAGVIHILAISGLHIGIIYLFLSVILRFLRRIKYGKFIQLVVVLAILWLFALVSGMSPSVTRAVVMFSLVAIGKYSNRINSLFNVVAGSALLLLIYNPLYLFDLGFQLSYAAVISILLWQPFFYKFYFSKNKIIVYFTDIVLVSLAAQLGVIPLMLLYFKQLPTLFLLANLVVIPLATLVLILGIICLFLNFTIPIISVWIGKIISFLVSIMNAYIHVLASFKDFILKDITFTTPIAILLYMLIFLGIYWVYKPSKLRFSFFLGMLLLFQTTTFYSVYETSKSTEMIIYNNKPSLISIKENNQLNVFSDDSLIALNKNIKAYQVAHFNLKTNYYPLENVLYFKSKKILIIDSSSIYNLKTKPDLVILTQNTKINLNRLIAYNQPKMIVADKTNSYFTIKRWKETCLKNKIPFHAVAEKGFYKIE